MQTMTDNSHDPVKRRSLELIQRAPRIKSARAILEDLEATPRQAQAAERAQAKPLPPRHQPLATPTAEVLPAAPQPEPSIVLPRAAFEELVEDDVSVESPWEFEDQGPVEVYVPSAFDAPDPLRLRAGLAGNDSVDFSTRWRPPETRDEQGTDSIDPLDEVFEFVPPPDVAPLPEAEAVVQWDGKVPDFAPPSTDEAETVAIRRPARMQADWHPPKAPTSEPATRVAAPAPAPAPVVTAVVAEEEEVFDPPTDIRLERRSRELARRAMRPRSSRQLLNIKRAS